MRGLITFSFKARRNGEPFLCTAVLHSAQIPRAEPDNAQTERREDSNINQCINHVCRQHREPA
jgi:hypothetical protein